MARTALLAFPTEVQSVPSWIYHLFCWIETLSVYIIQWELPHIHFQNKPLQVRHSTVAFCYWLLKQCSSSRHEYRLEVFTISATGSKLTLSLLVNINWAKQHSAITAVTAHLLHFAYYLTGTILQHSMLSVDENCWYLCGMIWNYF